MDREKVAKSILGLTPETWSAMLDEETVKRGTSYSADATNKACDLPEVNIVAGDLYLLLSGGGSFWGIQGVKVMHGVYRLLARYYAFS